MVQSVAQLPLPELSALPPIEVCRRARLSRDPRFDGRFFIGVVSTGIYCRTTCPARLPKEENVRYFLTSAQAQSQGFRACRRCRPQSALRLPEWTIGSQTVLRGMRMIEAGFLNTQPVAALAAQLEIGERQLTRLFRQELGCSPKALARLARVRLVHQMLPDTKLRLADVAYHAGYGSLSAFNREIKEVYGVSPRALRTGQASPPTAELTVQLPYRGPYDLHWMFAYLQRRALPGLETVTLEPGRYTYQRRLDDDAVVTVRGIDDGLTATIPVTGEPMHMLLTRIRHMFDLDCDAATVQENLSEDPLLGEFVQARPGLRVPGCWDGFEGAVRAVLGQQVSVERGTELTAAMVERYGQGHFPTPARVRHADVAELGMPGRRGRAVAELARLVDEGALKLDPYQDLQQVHDQLLSIDGIGPWTVNYIRMRVLRDPDAFPDNDWVVMKALAATAAQARRRAEAWRPWRAYGLMYLWMGAGELRARNGENTP